MAAPGALLPVMAANWKSEFRPASQTASKFVCAARERQANAADRPAMH